MRVNGVVQGVGFRPLIYRLATRLGLSGFVLNDSDGVVIEVEGSGSAVDAFRSTLERELPALAMVESGEDLLHLPRLPSRVAGAPN